MEPDRVVLSLEEGRSSFVAFYDARMGCGMPDEVKTEPTRLHRVMIRCAESGEGVPTGLRIDSASFKTSNRSEQTFKCPHCGHEHTWSMRDAWTEAGAC
jgi:hypothetical protein